MRIIYSILTAILLCLSSCENMEESVEEAVASNEISILTEFSDEMSTTRSISLPSTHKLRCIIEVWTKEAVLSYRQEVCVEPGSTIPPFKFELPNGDYQCLMWADAVKMEVVEEDMSQDGIAYKHYADEYYDTSNLHSVAIKDETGATLFDTDLCDAFFASIDIDLEKGTQQVQKTAQLKRPFTKLIVEDKEKDKVATLKGMKVEYTVPKAFNVSTGAPTSAVLTTKFEKEIKTDDSESTSVLFQNYIFADVEPKAFGEMHIVFSTTTTDKLLDCKITANSVMLKRNEIITASGNLIGGSTEIEPIEPELPDPKIGDYFFNDGTWGSSLTDENKNSCIGIVYEVNTQEGDDITDYGKAATGKEILGYVVALKNLHLTEGDSQRPLFYRTPEVDKFPKVEDEALNVDKMKFNGYKNTQKLLESDLYNKNPSDYQTLNIFEQWTEKVASVPNASGWYIPSAYQLLKIMGYCCGFENKISPANAVYMNPITSNSRLQEAFVKALEMGIAEDFAGTEKRERPVQSSTIYGNSYNVVERYAPDKEEKPFAGKITVKKNEVAGGYIRPTFTILK